MASEDIHVRSTSTCAELLPELETRFLQARGEEAITGGARHHCIALMQGESKLRLQLYVLDMYQSSYVHLHTLHRMYIHTYRHLHIHTYRGHLVYHT